MKKNLTKIVMLALTLCMMIAVFAVVTSAAETKEFVVELNKYYSFYNGMEHEAPEVMVFDEDGSKLDEANYTVTWTYRENSESTVPFDYYADYFRNAGAYFATVKGEEGTAYEECTVYVFFSILSSRGNNSYEFVEKDLDSTYGDPVEYKLEKGYKENAYHKEIWMFREVTENGYGPYTTEIPTDAGKYQYYVIDFGYYYYLDKTIDFEIKKASVNVTIDNQSEIYGSEDSTILSSKEWGEAEGFEVGDDVWVEFVRTSGVNVADYVITAVLKGDDAANYKLPDDVAGTFTITPATITVTLKELAGYTYGDVVDYDDFYTFEGVVDGDEDEIDFKVELDDGVLHAGANWFTVKAEGEALKNYNDVIVVGTDGKEACFVLAQRKLTADDFVIKDQLYYNGQLQTAPKVYLIDGALGDADYVPDVADVERGLEIVGSARKYGGTYYVTVVALTNKNYEIVDGGAKVEYTILAEGENNSDTAVKDFVDGVVNAGEAVGEVVEIVTPVFNAIGKVIADGIKALVNDFFSRVFG